MKAKTINAQITINLGNYESMKIGGEWEVAPSEDLNEAIDSALNLLRAAEQYHRGIAKGLPVLTKNNPRFVRARQAIKDGKATIEDVEKVFTLTDEIRNELTNY